MRRLLEWVHALPFRVASKFAITFTCGALVALAVVVTALALHERHAVAQAAVTDLEAQGRALGPVLGEVWEREGKARALEVLRVADVASADVSVKVEEAAPAEVDRTSDRVVVAFPIEATDAAGHYLVLEKATPSRRSALLEALRSFLVAGAFLAIFALLSSYALGEWLIGAPLRRVVERTRRIGEGDLNHPLVVCGSLEIAALKRAINVMSRDLERAQAKAREEEQRHLEAVNQLRHADRLTTVGTLSAGIAHELGTPLNVVLLESRAIARASGDPARVERGSDLIRNQAGRMATIVRQLLDFARRTPSTRTLEDARQVASSSAALVSTLARVRKCSIEVECPDAEVPFRIDLAGTQQILTNLYVNAFDAMPNGGRVLVRVRRTTRRAPGRRLERSWVQIEVEDEGRGMDEATMTRVFEPFFTTKDVGRGTGLGLSVAHGIAQDHGGFIEVRQRSPAGSVFAVYLPSDDDDDDDDDDDRAATPNRGVTVPSDKPGRVPAVA